MLKYVDTKVVFAEVPNEISLAISISGCPCHCKGCHSSYLAEDIGEELTIETLDKLITKNKGITCVLFMGGDSDPKEIDKLAAYVKGVFSELKVAWYSGKDSPDAIVDLENFDFIKLGPYKEEFGPLNKRTTNQKFYKLFHTTTGKIKIFDITYKFWKNETKN